MSPPALPTYRQLLDRTGAPPGSTWGLFGDGDERGMANLATQEGVLDAMSCVRRGACFSLDYPLNAFDPSIANRPPPAHHVVSRHRDQRDDYLDGFWPQASSQVDGLRHRRHHEHGFYGGAADADISAGSPTLGVNRWADSPIVARALLVDVSLFRAAKGSPIDHARGEHLPIDTVDEALTWQGSELRPGDCLLLHTGWSEWYLRGLDGDGRAEVCRSRRCTGVAQSHDMLEWLWDHRVSLAAADTFAFEALPASPDSPFGGDTDDGMMHQELIALLGLPLGELWRLHDLAQDCATTRSYESLLVVKPLNLTGGVGSPANAVAIR